MTECTLVRKDRAARFVSKTTWDEENDYGERYGVAEITINEGFNYLHPSEEVEVRMQPGATFKFYITQSSDEYGPTYLVIDEAATIVNGGWECMGRRNPEVLIEDGDLETALHELIVQGINILLMHAVNYDGCEGSTMYREEAIEHYGNFGIRYEHHSVRV